MSTGEEGQRSGGCAALTDVFEFHAFQESSTTVADFKAWDSLHCRNFTFDTAAEVRAKLSQDGPGVLFSDRDVTVRLEDMRLSEINDTMLGF